MTFFPVEHQVDPLADVLGHRDFGLVVEKLEHLVLFWRDVHGGGDLLPCHDGTMHDHTSTVNPVYNYSILLIVFFGPSLSRMTLRDVSSSGCTEVVFRKVMVLAFLWAGAWFGSMGCGSSTSAGSPGARSDLKLTQSDFGAQFDRSRCNDQGKQVITADTNGDGKPDVIKLFTASQLSGQTVQQLSCRQVDLNHDGKMDIIYSYNDMGVLIAEEFDLDFDGKFDERVYYQDSKKVRMDRDMDGNGRPDYTEFFEGGRLVRIERDANGDGRPDEWRYYEGGRLDRIGIDTTGSGRADRWERNPEAAEASVEAAPSDSQASPAPSSAAEAPPAAPSPANPAPAATKAPARGSEAAAKKPPSK